MLHITPNLYHCDKKRQKEIKRDKRFYGKYPLKTQFFPALAYHYIRILAARDLNSRKRVFLAFLCLRVALGGAYGSHSGFEFGNKLVDHFLLHMLHHNNVRKVASEPFVVAVGKVV